MNVKSATIKSNNFISIFADATLLYELSKSAEDKHVKSALAKSSILSTNCALEAGANSFIESVDIDHTLKNKIDRFTTLEKYDFVLQWHTEKKIPKGGSDYSDVSKLIGARNAMVHPKVIQQSKQFITEPGDGKVAFNHYEVDTAGKRIRSKASKPRAFLETPPGFYTEHHAKTSLIMFTTFMNAFVLDWWGLDFSDAEVFLFQTWSGSIGWDQRMIDVKEVEILLRNNNFLNIRFMGLYGLIEMDCQSTASADQT